MQPAGRGRRTSFVTAVATLRSQLSARCRVAASISAKTLAVPATQENGVSKQLQHHRSLQQQHQHSGGELAGASTALSVKLAPGASETVSKMAAVGSDTATQGPHTESDRHSAEDKLQLQLPSAARPGTLHKQPQPHRPHARAPRSAEVKAKIAASMKGRKLNDETRQKMREAKLGRQHALGTRLKMSDAHVGKRHAVETKAKISSTMRRRFAELEQLRQKGGSGITVSGSRQHRGAPGSADGHTRAGRNDPLVMERAVSELVAIRRQLVEWMTRYEEVFGTKPLLEDAAEDSPQMYHKFMRYIALRDFVRDSNM